MISFSIPLKTQKKISCLLRCIYYFSFMQACNIECVLFLVKDAHLSFRSRQATDKKKVPVNDVHLNQSSSAFRRLPQLSLWYLTMQQHDLFYSFTKGVISGPAGSGKTLLIMLKVYELVAWTQTSLKILIVACFPHDLRLKKFFNDIGIDVYTSSSLPLPANLSQQVVLMEMKDFASEKSTRQNILKHNVQEIQSAGMHLFIDDSHEISNAIANCSDCFENLLLNSISKTYIWISWDSCQQSRVYQQFLDPNRITYFRLTKILRNSKQIGEVVSNH